MSCKDECAKYNKGVRQSWWCGFLKKREPAQHEEHDWLHKGVWYHCYG